MTLHEAATVIGGAYLLAALPIVAALAAGKASPFYRLPLPQLAAWWSRLALALVAAAWLVNFAP